ncbi:uncharacterized protein SPSC_00094 [Sporisorium scitamineum]|uniref:Uncharacterized protein n=1 Tax=Sporisorium scitamineum TaxID=49012 RepID=A0A127Z5M1_9BASI|nr:uncharacterized protein SPSC_00094 [Sporisorium scitamineum]
MARLYYPLLAVVLFWVFCLNSDAAFPGLPVNPGAPAVTIHYNLEQQGYAQTAAGTVETKFGLPRGYLQQVYGYDPDQLDAWRHHINSQSSRFIVVNEVFPDTPLVLSPSNRSLLFLQVLDSGDVVPMGYAVLPVGVPPGHTKDLFQTIQEAATMSRRQLVTEYKLRRLTAAIF